MSAGKYVARIVEVPDHGIKLEPAESTTVPAEPAAVQRFFPPGTRPDVFEGRTYVGLVPFRMVGTGLPHGPAVPYLGSFLETNIRLYSIDEAGRRGVVFRSLDANRLAVVATART